MFDLFEILWIGLNPFPQKNNCVTLIWLICSSLDAWWKPVTADHQLNPIEAYYLVGMHIDFVCKILFIKMRHASKKDVYRHWCRTLVTESEYNLILVCIYKYVCVFVWHSGSIKEWSTLLVFYVLMHSNIAAYRINTNHPRIRGNTQRIYELKSVKCIYSTRVLLQHNQHWQHCVPDILSYVHSGGTTTNSCDHELTL